MGNHHVQWENSLYMAIFHSYVKLPDGIKSYKADDMGDENLKVMKLMKDEHFKWQIFASFPIHAVN